MYSPMTPSIVTIAIGFVSTVMGLRFYDFSFRWFHFLPVNLLCGLLLVNIVRSSGLSVRCKNVCFVL